MYKQLSTIWVCGQLALLTLVKQLRSIIMINIKTPTPWSKNPRMGQEGGEEEPQQLRYEGGQGGQGGQGGLKGFLSLKGLIDFKGLYGTRCLYGLLDL